MSKNRLLDIVVGLSIAIAAQTSACADVIYASYTGSQQGVTVRDLKLNQTFSFDTAFNASGIAAGPNNDVYLVSGNHIYNYSSKGALITEMTFPDPNVNYTSVAISGKTIYASYTGSQQGVTVRDLKLNQTFSFDTGFNARGIAAGPNNDVYLVSGNHIYNYSLKGALITEMTFPDNSIIYTDVAYK